MDKILSALCRKTVGTALASKDKPGQKRANAQVEDWLESGEDMSDVIQVPGSGGVVRAILERVPEGIKAELVDFVPQGCEREFLVD